MCLLVSSGLEVLWPKKPAFCSKTTNDEQFSVLASPTGVPHSLLGERNAEILSALKVGRWMSTGTSLVTGLCAGVQVQVENGGEVGTDGLLCHHTACDGHQLSRAGLPSSGL